MRPSKKMFIPGNSSVTSVMFNTTTEPPYDKKLITENELSKAEMP
jgi:hypothetical protein